MEWQKIRQQYPDQFVLIANAHEEQVTDNVFRIVSGELIEVSKDPSVILKLYQEYKSKGKNVLYALPSTPAEFIIENVAINGVLK